MRRTNLHTHGPGTNVAQRLRLLAWAVAGALLLSGGVVAQSGGSVRANPTPRTGGNPAKVADGAEVISGQGREVNPRARQAGQNQPGRGMSEAEAKARGIARRPGASAPTRGGGGGRGSNRSSGATGIISSEQSVDREARVLRLVQAGAFGQGQNAAVTEGEEFWTVVQLLSNDNANPDQFRLVLEYQPELLEPIAIDDQPLTTWLKAEPRNSVSDEFGLLRYEASLTPKDPLAEGILLAVQWRALRAAPNTNIGFGEWGDEGTTLKQGKVDLLGSAMMANDGFLSLGVSIAPKDEAVADELEDRPLTDITTLERIGGVRVRLVPPATPPRVGELFTIDVELDNTAGSALDNLSLRLDYDPTALAVIDADQDNGITAGINLLDSPFQRRFPFEYQIANAAYPALGRIDFRKGTAEPTLTRGKKGTVARIYARALRPTAVTYIRFLKSDGAVSRGTEVSYLGRSVLGNPQVEGDSGLEPAVFPILNAPRTRPSANR